MTTNGPIEGATRSRALVIPMWNEAERIRSTLEAIASSPLNDGELTMLLVDDGSTDRSVAVAQQALDELDLTGSVLARPHAGKGAAVRAGVLDAAQPVIVFTDADLSAPVSDITKVFEALDAGRGEVVTGIRDSDLGSPPPPIRRLARRVMRDLVKFLGLTSVPDTQCGLKGFTRDAAHAVLTPLTTSGFAFDVELLARAEYLGLRIHTVSVGWRHAEGSTLRVANDAPAMILELLKMRWHRRTW